MPYTPKGDPRALKAAREYQRRRRQDPEFRERCHEEHRRWRENNQEYHRASARQWYYDNREHVLELRDENKDKRLDTNLRSKFGISLAEYNEMLSAQNDVCAICERPESMVDRRRGQVRRLAVDHCHNTGEVRGLLCSACNTSLGQMRDDVNALQRMIDYLLKAQVDEGGERTL